MQRVTVSTLSQVLESDENSLEKMSLGSRPPYGRREGFVPSREEDFGGGGAYPECHVAQFPRGMGRNSKESMVAQALLRTGMTMDELMDRMGGTMLHKVDTTPEYESFLAFMRQHGSDPASGVQGTAGGRLKRVVNIDAVLVESMALCGKGCPLLVEDACRDWTAMQRWQFESLKKRFPKARVAANDRAPARHKDSLEIPPRPQRTAQVALGQYINYVLEREGYELHTESSRFGVPFYLNGWKAFSEYPELLQECPLPYFTAVCDQTLDLMRGLDKVLFGKAPLQQGRDSTTWCTTASMAMSKVFAGPRGTITRLHYDSGDAHGWLAQVRGRKLFVLYSPEDTRYLYEIPDEKETRQSYIDPLKPDFERFPLYRHAKPIPSVVNEGEAILIPKGWWHYAVSLDSSITVMRNFYNANTNTKGMVQFMLKSVVKDVSQAQDLQSLTK